MLSSKEVANKKFETNGGEIMEAGAEAIGKMMRDNPVLVLLEDELTSVVAMTAAIWAINKQKKEDIKHE